MSADHLRHGAGRHWALGRSLRPSSVEYQTAAARKSRDISQREGFERILRSIYLSIEPSMYLSMHTGPFHVVCPSIMLAL